MGYSMNGETLSVNYNRTISVDTTQYAKEKTRAKITKLTKQQPPQQQKSNARHKVGHTGYLVPVGKTQRQQAKIAKVGRTHHSTKHAEVGKIGYNNFDLEAGLEYVINLFNPNKK